MAKNFFAPVRMASNFVDSDLLTVMYQESGANAPVKDGTIVVPGDFIADPVYGAALTAAGATGDDAKVIDINTRIATLPAAATDKNICVIDLATVPTAIAGANVYRVGSNTIGLVEGAGVPVRARVLRVNDTFNTGEENCTAALTVGQFATVDPTGKWAPAAIAPAAAAGLYCKVARKYVVTQGIDANVSADGLGVQAYMLCVADIVVA